MSAAEEWRPIPGLEGWYDASNLGRIRRAPKATASGEGRAMRAHRTNRGYLAVQVCYRGARNTRKVHCLVAEAFIGRRPIGAVIDHVDGDKRNNRAANLEYVSPAENSRRAKSLGLVRRSSSAARCSACRETGHRIETCGRPDKRRPRSYRPPAAHRKLVASAIVAPEPSHA